MLKPFLAVLFVCAVASAQSERGSIVGVVTDASGARMPNVAVTIRSQSTNISVRVETTTSG